jgi:uncharacterized membrane protein YeiH
MVVTHTAVTISGLANVANLTLILDLIGTFVFALSGASAGVKHKLDIFGVLVLSFAAANFGGIARDLLIGAVPPPGLSDWRYIVVPLLAGLFTFFLYPVVDRLSSSVLVFDAVGLAVFAVSGAVKALAFHLGPLPSMLLGMLTGIGGGMVRDLLVTEIPTVLRSQLYAVAALAGAAVVVIGKKLNVPSEALAIGGAVLCFALRFIAIRRGWHLPIASESQDGVD